MGDRHQYLLERLRQNEIGFGERLKFVQEIVAEVDAMTAVKLIRQLLDCALHQNPSLEDLHDLCEASSSSVLLHDYLRGFFVTEETDQKRVEMATRLDEVLSYRLSTNDAGKPERRLRQTIAEYLLRARN